MKTENIIIKIGNVQNETNNYFYNKNNILNKENKEKENDSFRNIFNDIANKKDELSSFFIIA